MPIKTSGRYDPNSRQQPLISSDASAASFSSKLIKSEYARWGSVALVLCLMCASFESLAENHSFWVPVPLTTGAQRDAGIAGGEGFQKVMAINYAPSNAQVVYLASDTSQVWKSTDAGANWFPINRGFHANGARSLFVHPKDENVVIAAGFLGRERSRVKSNKRPLQGIYRTTDGGRYWSLVHETSFYKQDSTSALFAVDSTTLTKQVITIYAGTYESGLLQSPDNGSTWHKTGFHEGHIIGVTEAPEEPGTLFILTDTGIFLFADGIATRIGDELPAPPVDIAVSRTLNNKVFVAVGKNRVFVSTDMGHTFRSSSSGLPISAFVSDIEISPINNSILYLATHKDGSGPFYSNNGGVTWHRRRSVNALGLTEGKGFYFSSPFAPHPSEPLVALTASNGRARVLKTEDGGRNWFYSGSGYRGARVRDIAFISRSSFILALTDHGLWKTEDGGKTFKRINFPRTRLTSSRSVAERNGVIVASIGSWNNKAIAVSRNDGSDWELHENHSGQLDVVTYHPQNGNVIYAGQYRSIDGGVTWSKMAYAIQGIFRADGNIIYAFDRERSSIVKSTDGGRTWGFFAAYSGFGRFNAMAIDLEHESRVYVAGSQGITIFDGEQSLHRDDNHGLSEDVHGSNNFMNIAIDPLDPLNVYAGKSAPGLGTSNGIFQSHDRGLTWTPIALNLEANFNVWSITCNPFDGSLYLGTSHGLYKYLPPRNDRL